MNFFVLKKCVHYAQPMGDTGLQLTPSVLVNVRVIMLPNNTFPGCIVDAHMCIEIAQKDMGF